MKYLLAVFFCVLTAKAYCQQLQCSCSLDASINNSTANCKETKLANGSKLYYQFNCDSVWLTLENKRHQKKVIYSLSGNDFKELYGYNFRIGYQLMKEYKKYLLFRAGCPANGPCDFILIDKSDGRKVKQFGELIYDYSKNTFYSFIVFFSKDMHRLTIYYPDTKNKFSVHINHNDFTGAIPEFEFDAVWVKNNVLSLSYGTSTILIDLLKHRLINLPG